MLTQVNESNMYIYLNLVQAYEAEFSKLTKKLPDINGLFPLDTNIGEGVIGYLWYLNDRPVGFILIDLHSNPFNISEFYIIPSLRKNNLGASMFLETLKIHPGKWQVKQIQGAFEASNFWRKVINNYTNGTYTEDTLEDNYWGIVTRQKFTSN